MGQINSEKSPDVIIEVQGGVAHVIKKNKGISLIIRDYDTDNSEEPFIEQIYKAEEIEPVSNA